MDIVPLAEDLFEAVAKRDGLVQRHRFNAKRLTPEHWISAMQILEVQFATLADEFATHGFEVGPRK